MVLRAIKRAFSPTIHCKLSCQCGKIQGHINAKWEDSIRIHCYCTDCRSYANYIAKLGNHEETTIGKPHGDNRVVQVCKSAITIEQGKDFLGLARKAPPEKAGKLYMHRYFAKCCHVPLMNTVEFLGFVGVFTHFLDANHKQFDGPVGRRSSARSQKQRARCLCSTFYVEVASVSTMVQIWAIRLHVGICLLGRRRKQNQKGQLVKSRCLRNYDHHVDREKTSGLDVSHLSH